MRDSVKKRTAVQAMIKANGIMKIIDKDREEKGSYSTIDFFWDETIDNLVRVIEQMVEKTLTERQIRRISSECRQIRER